MIENVLVKSAVYEGDGVTTAFDIQFDYKKEESIVPYLYDKELNVLTKISDNLFAISQDGQQVIYPVEESELAPILKKGQRIIILRETDITQIESSSEKSFKSDDIERALDKLTRITQELAEQVNRSVKYNAAQDINLPVTEKESRFYPAWTDAQKYVDNLNLILRLAKEAEVRAEEAAENAKKSELEATEQASIATAGAVSASESADSAKVSADDAAQTLLDTRVYAEDVRTGLQAKQDKLVAGKNITILNNVISAQTAFDVASDGVTTTFNEEGKLSVIGQKEKNFNIPIADWQGTLEQWQEGRANGTISDTDRCYVTDDFEAEVAIETLEGVLREEFEARLNGKQDKGDYATIEQLQELDVRKQDSGDYARMEDIPQIPSGVSAFINDAQYIDKTTLEENYTNNEDLEEMLDNKMDKDDISSFTDVLKIIYPIGSVYIGTMSVCPLSTLFGTWEKVSGGRVLQGSDSAHNADTNIEAGLPNITGAFINGKSGSNGAFWDDSFRNRDGGYEDWAAGYTTHFDASRSNPIYGKSNTVQPPAYVVNIWKRVA